MKTIIFIISILFFSHVNAQRNQFHARNTKIGLMSTITVTANTPASTSISGTIRAQYSTDGGSTWTIIASYTGLTNTRVTIGSFKVPYGSPVLIAFVTSGTLDIQFGRGGVSFTEFCGKFTPHNVGNATIANQIIDYGVNASGTTWITC